MFRSPSGAGLPPFDVMLDDVHATPKQIARHLGISEATLAKYRRTGNAPRATMLALFWETRWGRAAADVEAHNAAVVSAGEARALRDHQKRLAGVIWRLEQELASAGQHGGAANLPVWRVG